MNTAIESTEPDTLKRDRKAPQRRCIVTGEVRAKDDLLRFTISPEGEIVCDAAQKLPGRGYWLLCRRAILERAITKQIFSRAARQPVHVSEGLTDRVATLLHDRALHAISLANKAGQIRYGFERVQEALANAPVIALLHAEDGAEGGIRKLRGKAPEEWRCFNAETLGRQLGTGRAVHLALLDGSAATYAAKEIRRWAGFFDETPV